MEEKNILSYDRAHKDFQEKCKAFTKIFGGISLNSPECDNCKYLVSNDKIKKIIVCKHHLNSKEILNNDKNSNIFLKALKKVENEEKINNFIEKLTLIQSKAKEILKAPFAINYLKGVFKICITQEACYCYAYSEDENCFIIIKAKNETEIFQELINNFKNKDLEELYFDRYEKSLNKYFFTNKKEDENDIPF